MGVKCRARTLVSRSRNHLNIYTHTLRICVVEQNSRCSLNKEKNNIRSQVDYPNLDIDIHNVCMLYSYG